ncbi:MULTISPECIES: glycosyltransferase family 2 protein [unclassified Janthinobacterium]|uniref:glycosyltransferase family 2 protein n=1 Tax=unclassified Janthinobacterium TaxID=2610881 RepID=UPI0003481B9E|nr:MULTISPECIES: glycosyltransferase family 2 protein [unclassified Janthinobacterium]MEC5163179.1 biofilm PGA synthesis N-glycosyltransferase PgaC [Janthinobacterium sp. CG_S6]
MSGAAWLHGAIGLAVAGSLAYTLLLYVLVLALLLLSAREHRRRDRLRGGGGDDGTAPSRLALPVSVVATAYNEETMVLASVRSLLAQDYLEFELILVNDGSTDRTLEILTREYALLPRVALYRKLLPSRMVGDVCYTSATDKRLTVVCKENGGNKADAMNCGINFARYPYLCSVDGDTVYHGDALRSAMAPVKLAPDEVVGVTSFFGISRTPEAPDLDGAGLRAAEQHLLSCFQHLDLMRSFVAFRLGWARLGCMMCNPGGFAIWRRDAVVELGGFSNAFSCEDIELTFRVHEKFRREGRPYRIVSLPGLIARTEGPDRPSGLMRQRARWQKVVLEVVWHYRGMLLRPRYGSVGMLALPYFVLFEALAPLVQLFSLLALAAAAALGVVDWVAYAALLGVTAFAGAIPTTVALALHDAGYRDYRPRALLRMLLLGPLDLLLYRPLIILAGLRGTVQFLKGDRGWDKFARNVRRDGAAGAPAEGN